MPVLLLAGGLAVGVLAELADLLGGDSQDVLFSGQAAVPTVVAEDSAWIVLLLLVAKALAMPSASAAASAEAPCSPRSFSALLWRRSG